MSAADASSLSLWSVLSVLGLVLVILGVIFEGAEAFIWVLSWFRRKRLLVIWDKIPEPHIPRWVHRLDHIGWFVLVIGLAFETWGHIRVTDITGRENRRLTTQLDSTTRSASANALKVEELRAKNDALEAKQRPRTINFQQITNFIFLTEKIAKFPVRVGVGESRDETFNYAWQIREMLNQAKYTTPDSDTNLAFGTHYDPTAVTVSRGVGDTNEWADVLFVSDNTNDFRVFRYSKIEKTNGFSRSSVPAEDTNNTYGAFINAFIQIGMKVDWKYKPEWVAPNHCEIYVKQKPY